MLKIWDVHRPVGFSNGVVGSRTLRTTMRIDLNIPKGRIHFANIERPQFPSFMTFRKAKMEPQILESGSKLSQRTLLFLASIWCTTWRRFAQYQFSLDYNWGGLEDLEGGSRPPHPHISSRPLDSLMILFSPTRSDFDFGFRDAKIEDVDIQKCDRHENVQWSRFV